MRGEGLWVRRVASTVSLSFEGKRNIMNPSNDLLQPEELFQPWKNALSYRWWRSIARMIAYHVSHLGRICLWLITLNHRTRIPGRLHTHAVIVQHLRMIVNGWHSSE
jgi:hypothetical protein